MPDSDTAALSAELIRIFQDAEAYLNDDTFDRLARRVFVRNFNAIPAYAAYCRARGCTPATLGTSGSAEEWTRIPAVPTAAFKELTLRASDMETARVFRTSGTTRGPERRGEHHVGDLELYRASLRPTFRSFLLPDQAELPFFSLMPAAATLPDSSLAFMISDVMEAFGADGSRTFAGEEGVDFDALERALEEELQRGRPVLLLGTSAAYIHWLDRLERANRRFTLPAGSRLMDTGGYKGMGREVDSGTLRTLYQERLGIPVHACVNEYGMTELLSQRYDDSLRAHKRGRRAASAPAVKRGPGWLRSVAVDPETLDPLPEGASGILRHVDLANLHSVAAIQTEDFGRVVDGGVLLEGRAIGAPPRGCSIAMDLLLGGAG